MADHGTSVPMKIRVATEADAEAINAIYNHYVRTSAATFQMEDETTEERVEELRTRPPNQPMTVLEDEAGRIVGLGALSAFQSRCAYRDTVELSAYVRHDSHRKGHGRGLVQDLIARARSLGYHTILAASCEESAGMIRLLQSLGFAEAGRLRQVGRKFGRRLDVIYLQLILADSA